MKLRELMTPNPIRVAPETPVDVAARLLAQYNIGVLPVCTPDGQLRGLLTDRDIVTRCLAAGLPPADTRAGQVMTRRVVAAQADLDASAAARLMGREQIRRLPVVENGVLQGMLSLADLAAHTQTEESASKALSGISSNLSKR